MESSNITQSLPNVIPDSSLLLFESIKLKVMLKVEHSFEPVVCYCTLELQKVKAFSFLVKWVYKIVM